MMSVNHYDFIAAMLSKLYMVTHYMLGLTGCTALSLKFVFIKIIFLKEGILAEVQHLGKSIFLKVIEFSIEFKLITCKPTQY